MNAEYSTSSILSPYSQDLNILFVGCAYDFAPKLLQLFEEAALQNQAGGGGGSYCNGSSCSGASGGNSNDDGMVQIVELPN